MAGKRRAEYVSIPLGPGVLSNTTGRGARTRINYMNWDRWTDSTWVRWHKMLPEKQGGWQYQALVSSLNPEVIPGSPLLLLHFNPDLAPVDLLLLLHFDVGTQPLAASLLLHFDGGFTDSSVYNNTMTVTGATVEGSQVKFGSGAMNLVPTAQDYISTPVTASGPLDVSTGDWTIECFVYLTPSSNPSGSPTSITCASDYLTNNAAPSLTASVFGGQIVLQSAIFGAPALNGIVPTGVWTHIALVRNFQHINLFIDGVLVNNFFSTAPLVMGGGPTWTVGASIPGQVTAVTGYIDEYRFTKGAAVYLGNFTPPTAPFPPTTNVPDVTSTVDSSVYANAVQMGAGKSLISTTAPKWGSGCLDQLGANFFSSPGFAVRVPFASGSPLDIFTTENWTIQGWYKVTNTPAPTTPVTLFAYGDDGNGGVASCFQVYIVSNGDGTTGQINLYDYSAWGTTVLASASIPLVTGTWYHFAVVSNGGAVEFYLDGIATVGHPTGWNPTHYTYGGAEAVCVGSFSRTGVNGLDLEVDEFVIAPIAMYTANFTPPTGPFGQSINVVDTSQTFDSSVYANPVTLNTGLGAQLTTSAPKFGAGALKSDANFFQTFCCEVPYALGSPLDILGKTEWTVECFVKITSAGSFGSQPVTLWAYGDTGAPGASHALQLFVAVAGDGTTGTLELRDGGAYGTSIVLSASISFVVGTWYHVAVVEHQGVMNLYLNGVQTLTDSGNFVPSNYSPLLPLIVNIGAYAGYSGGVVPAEIDEFRVSNFAVYTSNFTPPTVEDTLGLPNSLGTPNPPNGFEPAIYLGLARALHDWSSIDGQFWIAIGTHVKLYVVNQATLYDITPTRKTSNVVDALTTTNGLTTVTVVDDGHQAATGDYVDISGAVAVGGLLIFGSYEITVIDPSSYTITAASAATSSATGGGNFSIAYEIGIGLPSNGELLGYGTGRYGLGTYGTPRQPGTGVFARLRTWSLDNYGQDLIASPSDGGIYIWERDHGPNSRAIILANAPDGVQRVIVDAQQHVIIALGCTDVTSVFNAMLVRWCSFNDITDWVPTDVNTAGDDLLTAGSRIITGLKTKGQNLIWTDTTIYRMVFVGQPDVYDFIPAGDVVIVGPEAAVDVDGVAYFMGYDNIYNYSGTLNVQGCDVWETLFDPAFPTSLLRSQAEKVVCYTYEPKTEVTWLYPSIGGSGENDRYVTFNWEDGTWYYGAWNRTCAAGRAPAMQGYPYGVNAGYLYQHEIGTDAVEAAGTIALGFYMKSLDITVGGAKSEYTMGGSDARFAIGGSDSHLLVRAMIPDWKRMTGEMNLTLFTKDRPQEPAYVQEGPVQFDVTTDEIDIDAHGSQIVIQLDNFTDNGQPSLGSSFRMGIWQGLATPYAKR